MIFVFAFQSRAALSLLGFCYYRLQDFASAADWWEKKLMDTSMMIRCICILTMATCQCSYEQLVQMHPEVDDYKLYYAQVCSEWLVHVCRA